jgi:hypothetical protein
MIYLTIHSFTRLKNQDIRINWADAELLDIAIHISFQGKIAELHRDSFNEDSVKEKFSLVNWRRSIKKKELGWKNALKAIKKEFREKIKNENQKEDVVENKEDIFNSAICYYYKNINVKGGDYININDEEEEEEEDDDDGEKEENSDIVDRVQLFVDENGKYKGYGYVHYRACFTGEEVLYYYFCC